MNNSLDQLHSIINGEQTGLQNSKSNLDVSAIGYKWETIDMFIKGKSAFINHLRNTLTQNFFRNTKKKHMQTISLSNPSFRKRNNQHCYLHW